MIVTAGDDDGVDDDNNADPRPAGPPLECWHFDSVRDSGNIRAAREVANKIYLHVYGGNKGKAGVVVLVEVIEADAPQQVNGHDCGVHLLGTAELFATASTSTGSAARNLADLDDDDDDGEDRRDNINNNNISNNNSLAPYETRLRESELGTDPSKFCSTLRQEIVSQVFRLRDAQDCQPP